ncbi:MAG TPA: glycine cleavage system protein GcvH [Myxococcales bacterium]|nr:glycine cleavage system protein GcvH [Myxococcales bacterium]
MFININVGTFKFVLIAELLVEGITQHAAEQLGDVVFVELPSLGDTVTQGASFGTVESVKAVSDLGAPMDGEVIGVNTNLENAPENVNTDPYNDGWLIQIKCLDADNTKHLMPADDYEQWLEKGE